MESESLACLPNPRGNHLKSKQISRPCTCLSVLQTLCIFYIISSFISGFAPFTQIDWSQTKKKHMMHLFTFWPPAAQRWQFRRKLGEMRRWEMGGREPQKPSRFPLLQQEVRCRLSKHTKSYSGFNGVSVSLFRWEPEQRSLSNSESKGFL